MKIEWFELWHLVERSIRIVQAALEDAAGGAQFSGELWAAIAWAVVGFAGSGLISFFLQREALNAATRERESDALTRNKALAHAIAFKMMRIVSNLHRYDEYLKEIVARAETQKPAAELWAAFKPLANNFECVHFTTDEMAMMLSLKRDKLFNDLMNMDQINNSTVALFETASNLRRDLVSQLPAVMDGEVGRIALPRDVALRLRPKMVDLNLLLAEMIPMCEQYASQSVAVLRDLQSVLNQKLAIGLRFEMNPHGAVDRKPD